MVDALLDLVITAMYFRKDFLRTEAAREDKVKSRDNASSLIASAQKKLENNKRDLLLQAKRSLRVRSELERRSEGRKQRAC